MTCLKRSRLGRPGIIEFSPAKGHGDRVGTVGAVLNNARLNLSAQLDLGNAEPRVCDRRIEAALTMANESRFWSASNRDLMTLVRHRSSVAAHNISLRLSSRRWRRSPVAFPKA